MSSSRGWCRPKVKKSPIEGSNLTEAPIQNAPRTGVNPRFSPAKQRPKQEDSAVLTLRATVFASPMLRIGLANRHTTRGSNRFRSAGKKATRAFYLVDGPKRRVYKPAL